MKNSAFVFENRYQQWRSFCQSGTTRLSSISDPYINNSYFQAIVDIGDEAVPYIIEKLQTDEDAHFLIHALERITKKRFTPEEIRVAQTLYGTPLGNQGYAVMWRDWWTKQMEGKL